MKIKIMGEGGSHCHKIINSSVTENDGEHKHIFIINERLVMTDLSGNHSHSIDAAENEVGSPNSHEHTVNIKTSEGVLSFKTENATEHYHEIQSGSTTLSGIHTHEVEINANTYISIVPADLIEQIENEKSQIAHLKNYKIRKSEDYPFEVDYLAVKRLNKSDFKDIIKKVAFKVFLKSVSRLSEGFAIESLILSRDRFEDIGAARRYVLDHDLNVISSRDAEGEGVFVFQVHAKERFDESTLHRIQITDGVIAVIGLLAEDELGQQLESEVEEAKPEDTLTENATQSTRESESVEGDINEFKDNMKDIDDLKEQFNSVSSLFDKACGGKHPKKEKKPKAKKAEVIDFQIYKSENEQRLVTGPILIPDKFDLQKDIISPEEIERAIHNYMIKLAFQDRDEEFLIELGLNNKSERGFMHTEFDRKIAFVEIFIVNDDRGYMLINGKRVANGTAVGTAKVFDDEVWALVKAGNITGFSIGGRSKVVPLEKRVNGIKKIFNETKLLYASLGEGNNEEKRA